MDSSAIEKYFLKIVDEDKNMSHGIAAIKTLLTVLEKTNCEFHHIQYFFHNPGYIDLWNRISLKMFILFSYNDSRAR